MCSYKLNPENDKHTDSFLTSNKREKSCTYKPIELAQLSLRSYIVRSRQLIDAFYSLLLEHHGVYNRPGVMMF